MTGQQLNDEINEIFSFSYCQNVTIQEWNLTFLHLFHISLNFVILRSGFRVFISTSPCLSAWPGEVSTLDSFLLVFISALSSFLLVFMHLATDNIFVHSCWLSHYIGCTDIPQLIPLFQCDHLPCIPVCTKSTSQNTLLKAHLHNALPYIHYLLSPPPFSSFPPSQCLLTSVYLASKTCIYHCPEYFRSQIKINTMCPLN